MRSIGIIRNNDINKLISPPIINDTTKLIDVIIDNTNIDIFSYFFSSFSSGLSNHFFCI